MGATFFNPLSADLGRSLYTSIHHSLSILPRWLLWFNAPLRILGWMFRYPRFSCAGLTVFTRMVSFAIFEYPRLEFVAQRIRYERYAESFDYVYTKELPSTLRNRRFRKEWLYQYQPLWRLCIPVLVAASNLIAGTWPKARVFLLYLPYSPKIHPGLLIAVGKATLLETALRVVGEVVWRYLRLDTASEDQRS